MGRRRSRGGRARVSAINYSKPTNPVTKRSRNGRHRSPATIKGNWNVKTNAGRLNSFMSAKELFQAGKLNEAIEALGAEVRDNPTDARRRTFLFELLCFKGDYDRAEKHLNILADASPDARSGRDALFFRASRRTPPAGSFREERLSRDAGF